MIVIPSPTDLAINFLLWVGLPALVLAPFLLVITLLEWRNAARAVLRAASSADRGLNTLNLRFPWLRFVALLVAGALVVASAFSLMRFYLVIFSTGDRISSGSEFQWQDLWSKFLTYSNSSDLSANAGLIALGWVLAVNLFAAVRSSFGFHILAFPAYAVAFFGFLSAGLWILYIFMIVFLVSQGEPGYNHDMLFLYGMGATLSLVFSLATLWTVRGAKRAFSLEDKVAQLL